MIDRQVESNIRANDLMDSSIKDRLFELIMLRFDELESFKKALKNIFLSTKKNPLLISIISKNLLNSFDFYLEVSNSYKNSPTRYFQKNFLLLNIFFSFLKHGLMTTVRIFPKQCHNSINIFQLLSKLKIRLIIFLQFNFFKSSFLQTFHFVLIKSFN